MQTGRVAGLVEPSRNIQLPRNSTRIQKSYAYVLVLSEVYLDKPYNTGFLGKIHHAGAVVPDSELGEHGVVLECVGPENPKRGKRTPSTWILWRWAKEEGYWRELARASAINWEWVLVLKQPAYEALHPRPEFYDVLKRGRELAEQLMETIEKRLNPEGKDVRAGVFASLYEQVAARIAGAE